LFFNAFGYGGFCKGRGGWTYGKDVGHQDKQNEKIVLLWVTNIL